MSDARKIVARLNTPNVRFDVGAGGLPELTAQDIAGALAFVQDPLAREVFCLLWWPAGARLTRASVLAQLRTLVWQEQSDRAMAFCDASNRSLHAAEELRQARAGADTAELRRVLAFAEAKAHAARRQLWPRTVETYSLLVLGVLDELGATRNCPRCDGRETIATPLGPKTCERCSGTGKVSYTNVARAAALGVDESTYRKTWAGVYDWLYFKANDMEQAAAETIRRNLR